MYAKNFFRRFKGLLKSFVSSGIVLMYHRISDENYDPYMINVSLNNFISHIQTIKKNFEVISVLDIPFYKPKRKKFVVITFDDGYRDNFKAFEVLDKEKIPASLFMVTGHLFEQNPADVLKRIFWEERLKNIFSVVIKELIFKIDGKDIQFFIDDSHTPESTKVQIFKREFSSGKHIVSKNTAFSYIYTKLKYIDWGKREEILLSIEKQVGFNSFSLPEIFMEDDIRQISACGFLVGAHTEHHEVLSILEPQDQEKQILTSKLKLERILGKKVETFAYPFGLADDFSSDTLNIVKSCGFSLAFSGVKGAVIPFMVNRYAIPRFSVMNWSKYAFEKKLKDFFMT